MQRTARSLPPWSLIRRMSPWTTGSSPMVTRWVLFGLYCALRFESPHQPDASQDEPKMYATLRRGVSGSTTTAASMPTFRYGDRRMLMRWFFALIFSCGVAFASHPPLTKLETPPQKIEQKSDSGAPKKQITTPNNSPSVQWINTIEQVVAAELQKASNYCTTDSSQKQDKWLQDFFCGIKITDVVIAIFSILLVFVTIGLVLVGGFKPDVCV